MRIRSMQLLTSWTAGGLLLATIAVLIWTQAAVSEAERREELCEDIVLQIARRRILAFEYIQYRRDTDRARKQWETQHEWVNKAIRRADFLQSDPAGAAARLWTFQARSRALFSALIAAHEAEPGQRIDRARELEGLLVSQLQVVAEHTTQEAQRMQRVNMANAENARELQLATVSVLMLALAAMLIANLTVTLRRIVAPLGDLTQAAARVEAGDLNQRTNIRTANEIGDFSRVFDSMTASLQLTMSALKEKGERLEASNQELDAFCYSIAHDLRTPLRAVDGFSRTVLQKYGTALPHDGQHYLDRIRAGAQQMGDLIDSLLEFSRIGRATLKRKMVRTDVLVQDCLAALKDENGGRKIEVDVRVLPDCNGDPVLLRQVWMNLLGNAFKYTGNREVARIEVGAEADNDATVYYVRDNGTGFDMAYVDKLFGVFQRLHGPGEFPGVGIGLALVKRITALHGGRVWAAAKPDQGATFFFTLGRALE